jgi:hypothetical protein
MRATAHHLRKTFASTEVWPPKYIATNARYFILAPSLLKSRFDDLTPQPPDFFQIDAPANILGEQYILKLTKA